MKSCDVEGCNNSVEKVVARNRVSSVLTLKSTAGNRVNLCREHYKQWKKKTKKERKVDRLSWV